MFSFEQDEQQEDLDSGRLEHAFGSAVLVKYLELVESRGTLRRSPLQVLRDPKSGFEESFGMLLMGIMCYGQAYEERYDKPILQDVVIGDAWQSILDGMRGLLNGELGRLDSGCLEAGLLALQGAASERPAVKHEPED